jgi:hypothetical protein
MPIPPDISINLPTEYLDALSEVILTGFQRAKIDPKVKKELIAWWNAEKEFIDNEISTKEE